MSAIVGVRSKVEEIAEQLEAQRSLDGAPGTTLIGHDGQWRVRLAESPAVVPAGAVGGGEVPLAITLLPVVPASGQDESGPPRLTLNSSLLPRMRDVGDSLVLSSTNGPRYATVRELGKGGMGEVDLVEDRDIGRTVAMKRLLADQVGLDAVARFVDEVRTIGQLEHPNIVPIHDVGVDERGRYFFVMKYVDGETLETILQKLRSGDPDYLARYDRLRRVEIFQQILSALNFAHQRGIVHRDVKPANVMVGRFGEVVLMDWGVARYMGPEEPAGGTAGPGIVASGPGTGRMRASTTQVGAIIGTPLYMSPEQARGENDTLDHRCDLYSAMLLFDEWIGLRHIREQHGSLLAVLLAASTQPPPTVSELFAQYRKHGVGAEYAHYVHKGLQLDPAARYQSAAAMIDELHLIVAGKFRVQCPITFSKRVSLAVASQLDRTPQAVIFGALALIACVLALMGYVALDLSFSPA